VFPVFWTQWSSNYRNAEYLQLWLRLGELGFEQTQCGYPEKSNLGLASGAFCNSCQDHLLL